MAFYNRSTFVVAVAAVAAVVVAATVAGLAGLTVTKQKNGAIAKNTFSLHFFLFFPSTGTALAEQVQGGHEHGREKKGGNISFHNVIFSDFFCWAFFGETRRHLLCLCCCSLCPYLSSPT